MKKLTATERKALIGCKVEWEQLLDVNRGVYSMHSGTLQDASGYNLLIDGDWKWYKNMINLRKAEK